MMRHIFYDVYEMDYKIITQAKLGLFRIKNINY